LLLLLMLSRLELRFERWIMADMGRGTPLTLGGEAGGEAIIVVGNGNGNGNTASFLLRWCAPLVPQGFVASRLVAEGE
jgi:hypothetical protein